MHEDQVAERHPYNYAKRREEGLVNTSLVAEKVELIIGMPLRLHSPLPTLVYVCTQVAG